MHLYYSLHPWLVNFLPRYPTDPRPNVITTLSCNPGAPNCNTVLQHFSCNMVDAIRTIPQQTLFWSLVVFGSVWSSRLLSSTYLFWIWCASFPFTPVYPKRAGWRTRTLLVVFGFGSGWLLLSTCLFWMLCFISVCLYPKRADCRTHTRTEKKQKKNLPRRPGHVAPREAFSCRCTNAAILNATSRAVHTEAFSLHCSVGRLLLWVSSTKAPKHQSQCTTRTQIWMWIQQNWGMLRRSRRVHTHA